MQGKFDSSSMHSTSTLAPSFDRGINTDKLLDKPDDTTNSLAGRAIRFYSNAKVYSSRRPLSDFHTKEPQEIVHELIRLTEDSRKVGVSVSHLLTKPIVGCEESIVDLVIKSRYFSCAMIIGDYLRRVDHRSLTLEFSRSFLAKRCSDGLTRGLAIINSYQNYAGELRDGAPHGQGQLFCDDRYFYRGEFYDGAPHGKGRDAYREGFKVKQITRTSQGIWRDGQPLSTTVLYPKKNYEWIQQGKDAWKVFWKLNYSQEKDRHE